MFWLQLSIILIALCIGARIGGVVMGMVGGMGLAVLVFMFGLAPSSPPVDVMLIITSVVLAAAVLQAAGGMDYMVSVAEKILRKNPKHITFVAPLVSYIFTFMAGTGNVAFAILPVIAEVARESGVRPERPMSISVIASQQAITASPISAAMAALVAMLTPLGFGMGNIMLVCVPATLCGIMAGALYANFHGKELSEDPEYLRRLAEGLVKPPASRCVVKVTKEAYWSVWLFLAGAVLIVLMGTIPSLRPDFMVANKVTKMSMTHVIEIVMLVVAGIMVIICKPKVSTIVTSSVFTAGMTGVICIYGLAWMGDTLVSAHLPYIKEMAQNYVHQYPWLFAIALFFVSALVLSQASTTRLLFPLAISLGMPPAAMIASWPAVNGYFLIPSYATLVAGVAFDSTGTTKIGKYVFNHSYIIPGLITSFVSIGVGFVIGYATL